MSIKVIFPPGATRLSVNGLHQWDYGRKIEIHADDLPPLVEVHFACDGMEEAVVRSCAVIDGVAEAAVPDQCLEQTTPVTAWVYEVGETSGETVKTIILPITPRTKPQPGATIPEDVADKYTQAVAAMTELVAECEQTVKDAVDEVVDEVEDRVAETLYNEGWTAKKAEYANEAGKAQQDAEGKDLKNLLRSDGVSREYSGGIAQGGIIAFTLRHLAYAVQIIAEVIGSVPLYSPIFYDEDNLGTTYPMRLEFTTSDTNSDFVVAIQAYKDGAWSALSSREYSVSIYYKHLVQYPAG